MKILSIDFDYWFNAIGLPRGTNGEIHCGYCEDQSSVLFRHNVRPVELDASPMITMNEVIESVPYRTPIYVAESHATIIDLIDWLCIPYGDIEVHNIDEHSDDEDVEHENVTCGNWALKLKDRGAAYRWVQDKQFGLLWFSMQRPDLVFICHSTPCLHRSGDKHWTKFLTALEPRAFKQQLVFIGHRAKEMKKRYTNYLWKRGVTK